MIKTTILRPIAATIRIVVGFGDDGHAKHAGASRGYDLANLEMINVVVGTTPELAHGHSLSIGVGTGLGPGTTVPTSCVGSFGPASVALHKVVVGHGVLGCEENDRARDESREFHFCRCCVVA